MVYGGVFDHDIGLMAPTERESLKQTLKGLNTAIDPDASLRTDRLVAGLRVRNRGRAPLQVSGISWRTPDSSRRDNAHLKFEGAPQMPTAIPPAGETIFYVALEVLNKQIALCKTWSDQPQPIWLEIWNANGEYRSENVPSEILALAPPR
jgi:hypothetical protein